MTFWERVRAYANSRVRHQYMAKHHHERRCPACQTWTNEVGGAAEMRDPGDGFEFMKCNKCSAWSRWDYRPGLVVVLADPWQADAVPAVDGQK